MKLNFAKTLLAGSAIAMGLTACGEGGSNNGVSYDPSKNDARIEFSGLESDAAGALVKFSGDVELKFEDENITDETKFSIDSMRIDIVNSAMKKLNIQPSIAIPPTFNANTASLSMNFMDVSLNLDDPAFPNECGTLSLIWNVFASVDGKKASAVGKIDFNRPDGFCEVAPESSSGVQEETHIEMIPYEVKMSTSDLPGLDLATGTASASTTADVLLVKANGGVALTSGNGTLFSAITNETSTPSNFDDDYTVDYWPEVENNRNAYMTDFMYKDINKSKIADVVDGGSPSYEIYVAKTAAFNKDTGAGFFAIAFLTATATKNGDFDVTLKVYKKK